MKDEIYFNFPICLMKEIFTDTKKVMKDIMNYALYKHTLTLDHGNPADKIKAAAEYFGIILGSINSTFTEGKILYNSIPERMPTSGINKQMLFNFYENDRPEYDIVLLAAFLGIKSILGTKPYCKSNIALLLSRMAGNSKSNEPIPEYILKYRREYHWKKLITKLETDWSLKYYSRYTKGFYASFELTLENLIINSEKNRPSRIEKEFKKSKTDLTKIILKKLEKS
jgi:hypothetical protein